MTLIQFAFGALLLILLPLVIWGVRWLWLLVQAEQRLAAGTVLVDPAAAVQTPETRSWLLLFRHQGRKPEMDLSNERSGPLQPHGRW